MAAAFQLALVRVGFDECCSFKPQFHFYGASNKKVNKNKVQNKKEGEKILPAALKSFPNACFWQGREIWYLAT